MYTRCPSCRAEICFDPPANAANLPEGYKHKIRCPNCGVTIGVKIPSVTAIAQTQPTFTPQNPYADRPEQAYRAEVRTEKADKFAGKVPKKLSGRPRSIGCFVLGVLLLATVILGYLSTDMLGDVKLLQGLVFFDGLSVLTDIELLKAAFEVSIVDGLVYCLPVIFFFAAALTVVCALICFAIGKFPRYLNFVWSPALSRQRARRYGNRGVLRRRHHRRQPLPRVHARGARPRLYDFLLRLHGQTHEEVGARGGLNRFRQV